MTFLTQYSIVTVDSGLVVYRIDYCYSLLYGISVYNINHIQRIDNSAAHIVRNTHTYYHITSGSSKTALSAVEKGIYDFFN